MNELENEIVKDMQNTIEGKMFLKYKSENGLDAANLIDSVKNIIARHQSVTVPSSAPGTVSMFFCPSASPPPLPPLKLVTLIRPASSPVMRNRYVIADDIIQR